MSIGSSGPPRFGPSSNNPNFRLSPDADAPRVTAQTINDLGVETYAYDQGLMETVSQDGARTFGQPNVDTKVIYHPSPPPQSIGSEEEKNKIAELVEKDRKIVKTFYSDGSVTKEEARQIEDMTYSEKRTVHKNASIERNIFPDATLVKKHLNEGVEIRKNMQAEEKLAGEKLNGKFVPFVSKNLSSGEVSLVGERSEPVRELFSGLLAEEGKKFSSLAKEVLEKIKSLR